MINQRVTERLSAMSPRDLLGIYRALGVQHRKLRTQFWEYKGDDPANITWELMVQKGKIARRYRVQEVLKRHIEDSYILRQRSFGDSIRESRESVRMA